MGFGKGADSGSKETQGGSPGFGGIRGVVGKMTSGGGLLDMIFGGPDSPNNAAAPPPIMQGGGPIDNKPDMIHNDKPQGGSVIGSVLGSLFGL